MPVAKLGRREKKKLRAKKTIEKEAVKLFTQKGFHGTKVSEIMEQADLGTGTFYNYYQSKEELFISIVQEKLTSVRHAVEVLAGQPLTAADKITRMLLAAGKVFEENQPLMVVFIKLCRSGWRGMPPAGCEAVFDGILPEVVRKGQLNRELSPHVPPEIIVELLHSILESAVLSPISGMTLTENLSYKLLLLLRGLKFEGDD